MRALVCVAVLATGCVPPLFGHDSDIPQGLSCSANGACPPGQECVAAEGLCRFTCDHPDPGCATGPGSNSSCACPGGGLVCDIDLHCRPVCGTGPADMSGGAPMCATGGITGNIGSCGALAMCDQTYQVCRPLCTLASDCSDGWSCTGVNSTACRVCTPPGVPGGGFDGGLDSNSSVDGSMPGFFASASPVGGDSILAMRGNDTQDVWATSGMGSALHRTNGPWTAAPVPGASALNALMVRGTTLVVAGAGGFSAYSTNGGGNWTTTRPLDAATQKDLYSVDSISPPNDVIAVGALGTMLEYTTGSGWAPLASGTTADLYRVAITAGGNETYAVGANGTVLQRIGGGGWTLRSQPAAQALRGLWVFGSDGTGTTTELWVVGDNGAIFRSMNGGMTWTDLHDGATAGSRLEDIWAQDNNTLWVVGSGGKILHTENGGTNWTSVMPSPTGNDLHGLYGVGGGTSITRIFIAGNGGTLLEGP